MELPIRKQNRLDKSHYNGGAYFVTILTKDRRKCLSEIVESKPAVGESEVVVRENIILPNGEIAEKNLLNIEKIYPNTELDVYVIMPNHIHAIIYIHDDASGKIISSLTKPVAPKTATEGHTAHYGHLSNIIKGFKQATSKEIHALGDKDFQWHKSFHDHVIRNEEEIEKIREYIYNNPYKRESDEFNI